MSLIVLIMQMEQLHTPSYPCLMSRCFRTDEIIIIGVTSHLSYFLLLLFLLPGHWIMFWGYVINSNRFVEFYKITFLSEKNVFIRLDSYYTRMSYFDQNLDQNLKFVFCRTFKLVSMQSSRDN